MSDCGVTSPVKPARAAVGSATRYTTRDGRFALLSPVSPMYTHSPGVVRTESRVPGAAHGPTDADSQSTLDAPATRHTPRSAPVVSSAKSHGSLPESLTVNQTPGWVCDSAAAEFSTS